MLDIYQPRTCPNCKRQITLLRGERRVEQCIEMTVNDPEWNDYDPATFNEGDWEAICYEVRDPLYQENREGCMKALPLYASDWAGEFMRGEVDGYGNELTNVKARSV